MTLSICLDETICHIMWLGHVMILLQLLLFQSKNFDKYIGRYSNELKCSYSIDKKPLKIKREMVEEN